MSPAAYKILDRLLCQITILNGVEDGSLEAVNEKQIRRSLFATATQLREEMAKPITVTPWTPFNQRGAE
jgi:hypothetical protein